MLTRITIELSIALLATRAVLAQTEPRPWNPAEFAPIKSPFIVAWHEKREEGSRLKIQELACPRRLALVPGDYATASAREYPGRVVPWHEPGDRGAPDWLTTDELLARCARRVDERSRGYRDLVQQMLRQGVEESQPAEAASRVQPGRRSG